MFSLSFLVLEVHTEGNREKQLFLISHFQYLLCKHPENRKHCKNRKNKSQTKLSLRQKLEQKYSRRKTKLKYTS